MKTLNPKNSTFSPAADRRRKSENRRQKSEEEVRNEEQVNIEPRTRVIW